MRFLRTTDPDFRKIWQQFLASAASPNAKVSRTVATILQNVRRKGDAALVDYTRRFDRLTLRASNIRLSKQQIRAALKKVSAQEMRLLERAARRIRRFHQQQKTKDISLSKDGARMGLRWLPLERIGIYVPGGRAAYPSTVLMNAIPAQEAGVSQTVMVTPTPDGIINPYTIAAAHLVGVSEIFRIGGAQAIAALAYGTRCIPAVDKIVGPGNIFVATAKQQVFGKVDIDMIAGPTEVLVIADASANPDFVASDLLSQAEHDPEARPVLIATSQPLIDRALAALQDQLKVAPRRDIARQALRRHGLAIRAKSRNQAIELANEMAAEHLLLMVKDKKPWLAGIRNAGAIFVGHYTPVAAGDYLAGPNHVLPTARTARYASPLGVYDFMKATSCLELSRKGLEQLSADIVKLSELEGLTAHGNSVRIRLASRVVRRGS